MTAPIVNLRGLLRGLHSHEVKYLVSGATAMVFYGYVRNTEDLGTVDGLPAVAMTTTAAAQVVTDAVASCKAST